MEKQAQKTGEAYSFFYYTGKDEELEKNLPWIQRETAPSDLEVSVIKGVENLDTSNDPAMVEIKEKAKRRNMSHVLRARAPNLGNKKVAEHLVQVMAGVYHALYEEKEPFNSGIVYKRGNQYVFHNY